LLKKPIFFSLGRRVVREVIVFPLYGRVFISGEMADGRMAEIEEQLEEK
jgi:hypothetical protein